MGFIHALKLIHGVVKEMKSKIHSRGHQYFQGQVVEGKPSKKTEKELLGLGQGHEENSERMIFFSFMKNKVIDDVKGLRLRLDLGQCQMKLKFNRAEHQEQGKATKLPPHWPEFSLCPPSLL